MNLGNECKSTREEKCAPCGPRVQQRDEHSRWVQCSAPVFPYLPARRTRSPPVLQSGQTEQSQTCSFFKVFTPNVGGPATPRVVEEENRTGKCLDTRKRTGGCHHGNDPVNTGSQNEAGRTVPLLYQQLPKSDTRTCCWRHGDRWRTPRC